MGYSLWLEDKETGIICRRKKPEVDLGNMLCIGGSDLMEFNITYNYAPYYDKAVRFQENGIRTIYGMSGKDSLPLLNELIKDIKDRYTDENGNWSKTTRVEKTWYYNEKKINMLEAFELVTKDKKIKIKEEVIEIDEGDTSDYWKVTAANAYEAILELICMAKECPEGIWNGD